MSRRSRIIGFGSAALLVVAGGVCTAVLSSGLAQDLALGVMGLGIVLAVSLVFLEVGYSEDRERAREEAQARQRAEAEAQRRDDAEGRRHEEDRRRHEEDRQRRLGSPGRSGRPTRLGRTRGRPRRLR